MNLISISQAVTAIQAGDVIAYPTEAVYGLGCDPFNHKAVEKLLQLKGRPMEKGMILIAASIEQCLPFVELAGTDWEKSVMESWPGPVTWVLPTQAKVPVWITGGRNSVAVRVTNHPTSQKLCEAFGQPLVSTSANPTDANPAMTTQQCHAYFDNGIYGIVEGELGKLDQPTQIWQAPEMIRLR